MIVVAENINVMSKSLGPAMRNRDPKPIQEAAIKLTENGADLLDLNVGPARKNGEEMMEWIIKTVQEVTDLPLFIDTTNMDVVEAGLKVYKPKTGKPVINSVDGKPERQERLLPFVNKYDCEIVCLMYGPDGIPRDENERGVLAADFLVASETYGVPLEKMWFDPIVVPVSSQQQQVISCTTFMSMLPDMAPGCKSTCGLSNVSNGSPEELRNVINRTYLMMLRHHGIYSAIIDGFDKDIIAICKGQRNDWQELVEKAMENPMMSLAGLDKNQQDYVKTVRILTGAALYSDSWLDL